MTEYVRIGRKLRKLLEKAEKLGWSCTVYEDNYMGKRTYVELGTHSPAGENFSIDVDFGKDQVTSFLESLEENVHRFDVDEHVERLMPQRGKHGCPSSVEKLIEDANVIAGMLSELYEELKGAGR